MMKKFTVLFSAVLLLAAVPALAQPPLKVLYSQTTSTHFNWTWPYHPVRTYTATQTKPYYYTGRILYLDTHINPAKYRFYYPNRTCKNTWGYYFAPDAHLCNHKPYPVFPRPTLYYETIR